MAIMVGKPAPDILLDSHLGRKIRLSEFRGTCNVVLAFFPLAWTPVWTNQIPSYQAALDRFDGVKAQVLGLSVDSVPCLRAWADSLGGISYPLLSDFFPHGAAAQAFGVLRSEGYSERAIFVIDRQGVIRYVDVHDITEQPDNEELFRVLQGLAPELAPPSAEPCPPAEAEPEPEAHVVMYCTPWCGDCKQARQFLQASRVDFAEVDISRNWDAARRVREWAGGKEVTPTFRIRQPDGSRTVVLDFDREKLIELLSLQ